MPDDRPTDRDLQEAIEIANSRLTEAVISATAARDEIALLKEELFKEAESWRREKATRAYVEKMVDGELTRWQALWKYANDVLANQSIDAEMLELARELANYAINNPNTTNYLDLSRLCHRAEEMVTKAEGQATCLGFSITDTTATTA